MASEAGRGAILVLTRSRFFNGAGFWTNQLNHAAGADRESRHEEDEREAPHSSFIARLPNDNPALESGYTELKVIVVSTKARGFEHKGVAALSGCQKARAVNLNTFGLRWIRTAHKRMPLTVEIDKPDARTALDGQLSRRDAAGGHRDRWWNGTFNGDLSRRGWLDRRGCAACRVVPIIHPVSQRARTVSGRERCAVVESRLPPSQCIKKKAQKVRMTPIARSSMVITLTVPILLGWETHTSRHRPRSGRFLRLKIAAAECRWHGNVRRERDV